MLNVAMQLRSVYKTKMYLNDSLQIYIFLSLSPLFLKLLFFNYHNFLSFL